jgi:AraC-like DNA-binding protein
MVQVLSAGRKTQPAGYRNDIRAYPQFMLLVVREGELWIEQAGRRTIARPTRVVVLTPGIDVLLSSPRSGYRGFYVEGYPAECALMRGCHLHAPDAALLRLCGEIEDELARPAADGLARVLLHSLFLRSLRLCALAATDDAVARVEQVLVHHRYGAQRLDHLLAQLPYSRRHLERLYHAAHGQSIRQRHLALRLEEAKRLLAGGGASVTTIALELGFPSSQHFATVFRRAVGCTPGAFARGV